MCLRFFLSPLNKNIFIYINKDKTDKKRQLFVDTAVAKLRSENPHLII